MRQSSYCCAVFVAMLGSLSNSTGAGAEPGLVGHWKLQGDCRDYSGHGNHGDNHGVDLSRGEFDGASAYVEVPPSDSLQLGTGDFAICAWIYTEKQLDDIVGDVIDMYDPALRRGITLSINSSAGGYQSQGTDRHVHFGIDNAADDRLARLRPPKSRQQLCQQLVDGLQGQTLCGNLSTRKDEKDWWHVYRYEGEQKWTDCGHVGDGKDNRRRSADCSQRRLVCGDNDVSIGPACRPGTYDPGRVYRYLGGTQWEDCGQPSDNRTLNCIASYKGKLYVGGGQ